VEWYQWQAAGAWSEKDKYPPAQCCIRIVEIEVWSRWERKRGPVSCLHECKPLLEAETGGVSDWRTFIGRILQESLQPRWPGGRWGYSGVAWALVSLSSPELLVTVPVACSQRPPNWAILTPTPPQPSPAPPTSQLGTFLLRSGCLGPGIFYTLICILLGCLDCQFPFKFKGHTIRTHFNQTPQMLTVGSCRRPGPVRSVNASRLCRNAICQCHTHLQRHDASIPRGGSGCSMVQDWRYCRP